MFEAALKAQTAPVEGDASSSSAGTQTAMDDAQGKSKAIVEFFSKKMINPSSHIGKKLGVLSKHRSKETLRQQKPKHLTSPRSSLWANWLFKGLLLVLVMNFPGAEAYANAPLSPVELTLTESGSHRLGLRPDTGAIGAAALTAALAALAPAPTSLPAPPRTALRCRWVADSRLRWPNRMAQSLVECSSSSRCVCTSLLNPPVLFLPGTFKPLKEVCRPGGTASRRPPSVPLVRGSREVGSTEKKQNKVSW